MKVSKADYKALKGSIKKWKKIISGEGVDKGSENCPLCIENSNKPYSCGECPISEKTGQDWCEGSPYILWLIAADAYNVSNARPITEDEPFRKGTAKKML